MLLEDIIMRCPSGEVRNLLTDANIQLVVAGTALKTAKENM